MASKKKGLLFYSTMHGCPHGQDLYETPDEVMEAEGCDEDDVLDFTGFFFKTPSGAFWGPYDNEEEARRDARSEVGIELETKETAPTRGSFYATNRELFYVTSIGAVWFLSDYMTATMWRLFKEPKLLASLPRARRMPRSWLRQQRNSRNILEKLKRITSDDFSGLGGERA